MEWAEIPVFALLHGARNDRERAAIGLLSWEGLLRSPEVASHITVTVGGDGIYDDNSAIAVIDWNRLIRSLEDGATPTGAVHIRARRCVIAVACSVARGHPIDLAEVADAVRHRADLAAWIASTVLAAAGHSDHVVRWPRQPQQPCYVRIVDATGGVVQEAGHQPGEQQWHEIGPPWLGHNNDTASDHEQR